MGSDDVTGPLSGLTSETGTLRIPLHHGLNGCSHAKGSQTVIGARDDL